MNITLRSWRSDDAIALAEAGNHKEITQYLRSTFPNPYTIADANFFIQLCQSKSTQEELQYAIVYDDKICGGIGLTFQNDLNCRNAELGYWLTPTAQGRGIVREAVHQICEIGFQKYHLLRIYAEVFSKHTASRRVLEKNGFQIEGVLKNRIWKSGQCYDALLYARIP